MNSKKFKIDCRHFSGYKPCPQQSRCEFCDEYSPVHKNIVIIHLGALGAVLRSTSLLNAIQEKYPQAAITWVTDKPADKLLSGHPDLLRIVGTDPLELQSLLPIVFDVGLVIDKSLRAVGISQMLKINSLLGFTATRTGSILPANPEAEELWHLGLDDESKFFTNQKSEVQLMAEMLKLIPVSSAETGQKIVQDNFEYNLPLTASEKREVMSRQKAWRLQRDQVIIGLNTGCSDVLPAKKLSIENHRKLIQKLQARGFKNLVLLGGPEDQARNQEIAQWTGIIESPTTLGLRDGLTSIAACDVIITGDSLGMHMAISQKKQVIAWFGPTCEQEIELYGRGHKVRSLAECSPCWKKSCGKTIMCYDQVNLDEIVIATLEASKKVIWETPREFLSFNPHF